MSVVNHHPNISVFNLHYNIATRLEKVEHYVLENLVLFNFLDKHFKEYGGLVDPRPGMVFWCAQISLTMVD